jgi:hypothetical protein
VFYVAFHRDEYCFAAPSFDALVKHVQDSHRRDPFANDAVIWSGPRVAAVVHFDGTLTRFEVPPPSPTSPAA